MDQQLALDCLSALSQPTRLRAFRLLIGREPVGIAAGDIARLVEVPQNTMSAHLAILAQCGLAVSERQSRSIVYRADLERFRALMLYLLQDCCGSHVEVCAPLLAEIAPCCPTQPRRKEKSRVA